MTTNKPEVFEVYRTKQGTLENVVLLADYEALQAESEKLRERMTHLEKLLSAAADYATKLEPMSAKLLNAIDAATLEDNPC